VPTLALLLAGAAPLYATAVPGDPSASVRAALDKASAAAAEQTRDAQLASLRVVAHALVDTQAMGRRAIGARFESYTEAQQQEFLRLFDELFVRSYLRSLLFRNPTFRVGLDSGAATRRSCRRRSSSTRRRMRWTTRCCVRGISGARPTSSSRASA
jgi:ABC-type transporter MlaC component